MILILCAALVVAQNGTVTLSAFPGITVADGRSTITITAEVRDSGGSLVPDGTPVVFETKFGTFRENIITTQSGFARAILVASSIPGGSRVRASALRFNAFAEIEVEFVADRSLLSTAKEYIEVVGETSLTYSVQDRIIEASGPGQGVNLRYRDIEIVADDLQLRVPSYEVRARKANLKIGKTEYYFDELYIKLNQRKGFGLATVEVDTYRTLSNGFISVVQKDRADRLSPVDVSAAGLVVRTTPIDRRLLQFQNITESLSIIQAKKAVAYPSKEVQFHKADVKLTGQSIMRLPLFQVSTNTASPIITEQFINVSNNQVAVNYPYYLSLKPGETSLLRFRFGNRYGVGIGASSGTYLDYELKWNQGDQMDGGLIVSGLARDDWGVGVRQFWQTNDRTMITAQVDLPAHRSLFANATISKPFDGFNVNFLATHGRSIDSNRFRNDGLNFTAEKDPIRLGRLPVNLYLGATGNQSRLTGDGVSSFQQAFGLTARLASNIIPIDRRSTLSGSYKLAHLSGHNVNQGLAHNASLNLTTTIGSGLLVSTTYDFVDDGFSSAILGRHRLSSEAYYQQGPMSFRAFVAKTLDLNRLNANLSLRYAISGLWRIGYSYYYDRFDTESFLDQSVVLGYKLGFREIGLSYSTRTRRLGFEILGTSF